MCGWGAGKALMHCHPCFCKCKGILIWRCAPRANPKHRHARLRPSLNCSIVRRIGIYSQDSSVMLCTASRTQVLGYRPLTTGRSKTHICINTGTCVFVQAGALKASRSLGPERAAPWQLAQPSEKEELLLSRCEVVARTNATARESRQI